MLGPWAWSPILKTTLCQLKIKGDMTPILTGLTGSIPLCGDLRPAQRAKPIEYLSRV